MDNIRKNLRMLYISYGFFALGMVFFALGKIRLEIWWWVLALLMMVVFAVLYVKSSKALRLDEGYSVTDAIAFYKACSKAGFEKGFKLKGCRKTAERFPFASRLSDEELRRLYDTGKTYSDLH